VKAPVTMLWSDDASSWFDDASTHDFSDDVLSNTEAATAEAYHALDDCDDATCTVTIDAEHKVNDYNEDIFAMAIDDDMMILLSNHLMMTPVALFPSMTLFILSLM
jgi:hypothetical protein